MKVKELIKVLEACNQEALVIHTTGNDDNDIFSSSEFDVFGVGELGKEYIELYQSEDSPQQL